MKSRTTILVLLFLAIGFAGRAVLKTQDMPLAAYAEKTAADDVSQKPTLVDSHIPVPDEDYKKAVEEVANTEVNRHKIGPYLTIAQYRYNHSNYDEALKIYQKILLSTNKAVVLAQAQYMVGEVYYQKKGYLPSLAAFQSVIQKYPKSSYASQARQMMEFMLANSLSLSDLQDFTTNYPDSPLKCSALFYLGSREAQSGKQSQAVEHLTEFTQNCPRHPSVEAAQLMLQPLQSQQEGRSWKIGVLVPLTGRFKSFGETVLNGVKLAVSQANQAGGSRKAMVLSVRDTAGSSLQAVKVFKELINDDSLDAIIGPVAPSEIDAVAPLANDQKITLICPAASRDGLSSLGPFIFSNSMTNEMQGRAIAKFAVDHLGIKRFGILSPSDGYGETLSDAFQKTVESMGATVLAAETYPAGSTDFKKQLITLGGQDPDSAKEATRDNNRRLDELKYAIGKEVGKIRLRTGASGDLNVALAPLVEGLTNTACPSIAKDVNAAVQTALKKQTGFTVRSEDLVQQALTRLPAEFKGNTTEVSADHWGEIADDMQASLVVTGRIVEIDPPNDWDTNPNWNLVMTIQAFQMSSKLGAFTKIYQGRLPCSLSKSPAILKANSTIQALYLPAHTAEVPLLGAQIRFYNLNPVFLGGHLWGNESIFQEGGKDLEGSYFVSAFYVDSQQASVKKFAEDYLKKFAKRPDLLAAQAYDAARLLLKAMESSGNRDAIHNELSHIRDFEGVSGRTTFGGHGEADKAIPVLKIQNGKFSQVQ